MRISWTDLRKQAHEIVRALDRNEQVTIYYRGKPKAVMSPISRGGKSGALKAQDHPAFGLWADRENLRDVARHLRKLRQGRSHDV